MKYSVQSNAYKKYEETLAMLKLLTLGNKQIEKGEFRSSKDVFKDLGKE